MQNGYRFIDSDAHVLEPADMFEKYLEPKFRSRMPVAWSDYKGEPLAFGFKLVIPASTGGEYVMPFGRDPMDAEGFARNGGISFDAGMRVALPGHDEAYAEFARDGFAPAAYPRAMERTGIDYMVVYPTAGLLTTAVPELGADTAAAYRRAYNNWLHDFCSDAGGRVFGAASIDLRDAEEAAREARRCVEQFGFKAVHVNPVPVGKHRLYDNFYEPLWNTLEDLDVPLAIHTGTGTAADEMLYYYLPGLRTAQTTVAFTIGNMLACTALIMLDIPGLKLSPIEYFQRQCYISADPDDPGIKQVIEVLGNDNVVTATDFAHPEGRRYAWAVKEVLKLSGVSTESKRKIMWDNALRLYPIRPD